MGYRVGVDIGGSFTDFAVFDEATRAITSLKVLSRPDEPGSEVVQGIQVLAERHGISAREITYFTHGTTIGVNTVIQRKGLRLALFTTVNFGDVLELARLKCADMYSLLSRRPEPLIPRDRVFGVSERIRPDGSVETPLDRESVAHALRAAQAVGAEGIVVALLHSYRNPAHELAVEALVHEMAAGLPVFCSSQTWPIIREYERTITALIGGYVQPRVARYLGALQAALKEEGVTPEPRLTKSNGGVMTAEQGKNDCVQMILSGTASGVIGASHIAATSGIARCLSLDIGGTSADVAIIIDGKPQYGVGELIGDFQIHIPTVSVTSIGEGGGSVAWVDGLGVLKVGPESAGSRPGPACYGHGGTRATITDAFAVCGLVGHSELGYNAIRLDVAAARAVVGELAARLGRSPEDTAEAIIQIAVSGMFSHVSGLTSRFGIDLREFSLLAFGGAGPMLGSFLGRELGTAEIVVPMTPGVLSALGGLIADLKNDFIKTVYLDLDGAALATIRDEFAILERRALSWLREDQGYAGTHTIQLSAEMRFRGQSFEIETALEPALFAGAEPRAMAEAFRAEHRRIYGHADPDAAIQVIGLRLVVSGRTEKPSFPRRPLEPGRAAPESRVEAWLDGKRRTVGLHRRAALRAGQQFDGPAIVTQDDCTTVVPPGYAVAVDAFANLRITRGSSA
jgi:N-methylhydantoinase A